MKKVNKISFSLACLGILMIATAILLQYKSFQKENNIHYEKITMRDTADDIKRLSENEILTDHEVADYIEVSTVPVEPIVFDNLTMPQLAEKLNRILKSDLAGKGELIATYSLQLGIDPYLATAIMLHETGCNSGNCSSLVKSCHNVGGQKGGPSCGGGPYKAYSTLEEGIVGYLDNIYKNYISYGLTTAETMASKYAASPAWPTRVNHYIQMIKNQ